MTSTTRTQITVRYVAAFAVAVFFTVSAAVFSAGHIIDFAGMIGLAGAEQAFSYLYVDGFVALGLLLRSPRHTAAVNKFGLWLMAIGGLVSLTCNIAAGHNAGQRIFGVITVAVAVLAERAVSILSHNRPVVAVKPTEPTEADLLHAKRSEAARKGAATKAAKKAAAAKPARKPRNSKPANAPVSPAGPVAPGLYVPSVAEVAALAR